MKEHIVIIVVTRDGFYLTTRTDGGRPELAGLSPHLKDARQFDSVDEAAEIIKQRKAAYRDHGKAMDPLFVGTRDSRIS